MSPKLISWIVVICVLGFAFLSWYLRKKYEE